jgi:hypothetical protein
MIPSPLHSFVGTQHGDMTCQPEEYDGVVTVHATPPVVRLESLAAQVSQAGGAGPPVPRLPPESD